MTFTINNVDMTYVAAKTDSSGRGTTWRRQAPAGYSMAP